MNRILTLTGLFIGSFILVTGFDRCRQNDRSAGDNGSPRNEQPSFIKPGQASGASETFLEDTLQEHKLTPDILTKGHAGKKKKKTASSPPAYDQQTIQQRMETIRRLRASATTPDIASSKQWLNALNMRKDQLNEWLALVNPSTYFCVSFDNDIFTNTDRYYTNGIRFDLIDPGFNRSFLTRLMIPSKGPARNYYGISLVHRMYTPWDPHLDTITPGERPFSSYFYLGFNRVSNTLGKRYRQMSALNIGLIGSAAQGEMLQEAIHITELSGWKYQISNDIILDYLFHSEAALIRRRSIEIGAWANARAGTLYDQISIGPYLITGIYDPTYVDQITEGTWGISNPESDRAQCFVFYRFRTTLVGYDATLQGGIFTRSEYTLSTDQIRHVTFEHNLGLAAAYKWVSFQAEYTRLSPEYDGCESHEWVRCCLTFTF